MKYEIIKDNKYEYVDIGEGPVVIFLHGLMGALSNFEQTAKIIAHNGYRIIIPSLPIYTLPILKTSAKGISRFLRKIYRRFKTERRVTFRKLTWRPCGTYIHKK